MISDLSSAGAYLLRRPVGTAPVHRLFCFPHAGGGAGSYFGWRRLLPADIELVFIQLPGRENRLWEPLAGDMAVVIRSIVTEMESLLDRPYSFFGHSFGALLAYECCVALQRGGHNGPGHMIASGANPPGWTHRLPQQDVIDLALERLCECFGWRNADEMDPDITDLALQVLRADLDMMLSHCFTPAVLPLHLTVLGAVDDPLVSIGALRHWASFSTSHDLVVTTGGHFFVDTQAERIVELLMDRVPGETLVRGS